MAVISGSSCLGNPLMYLLPGEDIQCYHWQSLHSLASNFDLILGSANLLRQHFFGPLLVVGECHWASLVADHRVTVNRCVQAA